MSKQELYKMCYKAMAGTPSGRKARAELAALGYKTETVGDLDRLGTELFAQLSDAEKQADIRSAASTLGKLGAGKPKKYSDDEKTKRRERLAELRKRRWTKK